MIERRRRHGRQTNHPSALRPVGAGPGHPGPAIGARLLYTARNILGDDRDAEECVSDTYLAIWNTIPPQQPEPLAGFVFKTGRNLALKRLRHNTAQKRNSHYDLSLDELTGILAGGSLDDALSARELGQAIDRFLVTLPKDSRVMFLRRYWFGDTVGQIAATLGYSENAVSVRLNRCRSKLRTYLEQEGYFYA